MDTEAKSVVEILACLRFIINQTILINFFVEKKNRTVVSLKLPNFFT